MIYLVASFFTFLLMTFLHIFLFRFLAQRGVKTLRTVGVYLFGFIISLFIFGFFQTLANPKTIFWWPLPLTSIVLYSQLSFLYLIFFTSPYLGDESPAAKIIFLVKKNGRLSYEKIKREFSDEELVIKRLDDLVKSGLIIRQKDNYYSAKSGQRLARIINFYRRLLHWGKGG